MITNWPVLTQNFDAKSLTFPMAKRTYPCSGNKGREKLFAETRLSLRGRPWRGREVKMSYGDPPASDLLALHALVFLFSLPFGRLPRRLLVSALRRRVLARFFPMLSILLCVFSYSSNIKHGVSSLSRVREGQWITFIVSSRLVSTAEYRFKI